MDYEDYHRKVKPNQLKLLNLYDMRKLGFDITKELLKKHGFTDFEINWVMESEDDESKD